MLSSIHPVLRRTKQLVLIAASACVLAGGLGTPAASAADNGVPQASKADCDRYFLWWWADIMAAAKALSEDNVQAAKDALGQADYQKQSAAAQGCGWAQRSIPAPGRLGKPVAEGDKLATRGSSATSGPNRERPGTEVSAR